MFTLKKLVAYSVILSLISACTTSPATFVRDAYKLDDTDICQNYKQDYAKLDKKEARTPFEEIYYVKLKTEFDNRDLTEYKCSKLISENSSKIAATIAAGIVAAALINEASKSGGYGNSYASSSYAWDAFYDSHYNLVWRCRDKSNGRFSNNYNCSSQNKVDTTWPGK